jgi:hypothetical protein
LPVLVRKRYSIKFIQDKDNSRLFIRSADYLPSALASVVYLLWEFSSSLLNIFNRLETRPTVGLLKNAMFERKSGSAGVSNPSFDILTNQGKNLNSRGIIPITSYQQFYIYEYSR